MTLLLRPVLLVQHHQPSMSKGLAVTSGRLLCASARQPGSYSCWVCCGLHGNGMESTPRRWCGTQATPPECTNDPVKLASKHAAPAHFMCRLVSKSVTITLRDPSMGLGQRWDLRLTMKGSTGCCMQLLHAKLWGALHHGETFAQLQSICVCAFVAQMHSQLCTESAKS